MNLRQKAKHYKRLYSKLSKEKVDYRVECLSNVTIVATYSIPKEAILSMKKADDLAKLLLRYHSDKIAQDIVSHSELAVDVDDRTSNVSVTMYLSQPRGSYYE